MSRHHDTVEVRLGRDARVNLSSAVGIALGLCVLALMAGMSPTVEAALLRGDANGDQAVDVSDAVFTLAHLFLGGRAPDCDDAADANDDGVVDISDPIAILEYLFTGGRSDLPAPFPAPGEDPTVDALGCLRDLGCDATTGGPLTVTYIQRLLELTEDGNHDGVRRICLEPDTVVLDPDAERDAEVVVLLPGTQLTGVAEGPATFRRVRIRIDGAPNVGLSHLVVSTQDAFSNAVTVSDATGVTLEHLRLSTEGPAAQGIRAINADFERLTGVIVSTTGDYVGGSQGGEGADAVRLVNSRVTRIEGGALATSGTTSRGIFLSNRSHVGRISGVEVSSTGGYVPFFTSSGSDCLFLEQGSTVDLIEQVACQTRGQYSHGLVTIHTGTRIGTIRRSDFAILGDAVGLYLLHNTSVGTVEQVTIHSARIGVGVLHEARLDTIQDVVIRARGTGLIDDAAIYIVPDFWPPDRPKASIGQIRHVRLEVSGRRAHGILARGPALPDQYNVEAVEDFDIAVAGEFSYGLVVGQPGDGPSAARVGTVSNGVIRSTEGANCLIVYEATGSRIDDLTNVQCQ